MNYQVVMPKAKKAHAKRLERKEEAYMAQVRALQDHGTSSLPFVWSSFQMGTSVKLRRHIQLFGANTPKQRNINRT
jgi:hypothetical protein